ncbi:hypothetical protein P4S81_18925 [Pseudoalteromonas sp. B28]
MSQFKLTTIAMVVASTLAAGELTAAEQTRFYDVSATNAVTQGTSLAAVQQKTLAERATVSGQKSIYDAQMGKATFLWQAIGQRKPDMALIAADNRNQYAADFYIETLTGISNRKATASSAVMVDLSEQKRGSISAKYKQQVNGVEVFNREYNLLMDKEYNLVASSGYFADTSSSKNKLAALTGFVNSEQSIKKHLVN